MGYKLLLFLLLTIQCFPQTTTFNWKKIKGPSGGSAYKMFVCGDTIFATVQDRLYFSSNNGVSWNDYNISMSEYHGALRTDSSLFISASGGLYKSFNIIGWKRIFTQPSYAIASAPNGDIYTIINKTVKKSTDKGVTWNNFFIFPSEYTGSGLLVTSDYVFVATNYFLYRIKPDSSSSFKQINIPESSTIKIFMNNSRLYAYRNYRYSYSFSDDNGETWTTRNLSEHFPKINISSITVKDGITFVVNSKFNNYIINLLKSTDNGMSWEDITNTLPDNSFSEIVSQNDALYISSYGPGIFKSTDHGLSWNISSDGINEHQMGELIKTDLGIFAATWTNGIHFSDDAGQNWYRYSEGLPTIGATKFFKKSDGTLFTLSGSTTYFRSPESSSWRQLPGPLNANFFLQAIDKHDNLYTVTNNKLYVSTDMGAEWKLLFDKPNIRDVIVSTTGSLTVIQHNQTLLRSSNNGISWIPTYSSALSARSSLIDSLGNIFINSDDDWNTPDGIFIKSTDDGITWNEITTVTQFSKIFTHNNGSYFAFTSDKRLFHSTDQGEHWTDVSGAIRGIYINDMLFTQNRIMVSTDRGLYENQPVTSVETENLIPKSFTLFQNYPNPFNASTVIKFSLQKEGFTTLRIYDITGSEKMKPLNDIKQAGEYQIYIDASKLASGVYLYELQQNGIRLTGKMILMK